MFKARVVCAGFSTAGYAGLMPFFSGASELMRQSTSTPTHSGKNDGGAEDFYRHVMQALNDAGVPFLIGGAYAFNWFTGISRYTKDLDIFIRRQDYARLSDAMDQVGYQAELSYPHWLAKIYCNGEFVDVIFNSGNGVAAVDDLWFQHAIAAEVMGVPAQICPVEETIWSKAFIMERERYDGADIVHLLRACSPQIDWQRLRGRFGAHWRVLLIHLTAFGFVYPAQRDLIPIWIMDELIAHLREETHTPPPQSSLCSGPLLSREQYLTDIQQWGYQDARVTPIGNMTPTDTATWTEAIKDKNH